MARKSTMVTSIDEIVGWNKMADGRILSNEEFDGENGHPVYLCPETESFFRLLLNHRMEKIANSPIRERTQRLIMQFSAANPRRRPKGGQAFERRRQRKSSENSGSGRLEHHLDRCKNAM